MSLQLETGYAPIVNALDPASIPTHVPDRVPVLLPLRPRRHRSRPPRISKLQVGHFCVSDHTLRRLEHLDPLGLATARAAAVDALVTMDTPLYKFMTPGQRQRAQAQHLHRLLRTLDRAPRLGLYPIPLVKGLDPSAIDEALDLLVSLGVPHAAFYARELLLERRFDLVRRFVRSAARRRVHPLLLGAFSPACMPWGPATVAGQHHYVLARRNALLLPEGRHRPLTEAHYSLLLGRFVLPGDRRGLCTHNYHQARQRLLLPTPLTRWDAYGG